MNWPAGWVLYDVIRSMTNVFLPQFADLLVIYDAWLKTVDARTKRSVESAIKNSYQRLEKSDLTLAWPEQQGR